MNRVGLDDLDAMVGAVEQLAVNNEALRRRVAVLTEALGHAVPQLVGEARHKVRAALQGGRTA